jgi:hypothetical protein
MTSVQRHVGDLAAAAGPSSPRLVAMLAAARQV